jgi:hypothetical protein
MCFSPRVVAYLNRYLSRAGRGDEFTNDSADMATLPRFVYVVNHSRFAAPSHVCAAVPQQAPEPFETTAARWTLQVVQPSLRNGAQVPEQRVVKSSDVETEYDEEEEEEEDDDDKASNNGETDDMVVNHDADSRESPNDTGATDDKPGAMAADEDQDHEDDAGPPEADDVAAAIKLLGPHIVLDHADRLVREDRLASILPTSATHVTLHNVRSGQAHPPWGRKHATLVSTLFFDPAVSEHGLWEGLSPRNILVGLEPDLQKELADQLAAGQNDNWLGPTRPASFVPPSADDVAAAEAARAEVEALRPQHAASVPAASHAARLAANNSVARAYLALIEAKAPALLPRLARWRCGPGVMRILEYAVEAKGEQAEAEKAGVPPFDELVASNEAMVAYYAAAAENSRLWALLQAKDRRASELEVKAAPTLEERLQFQTYEEAEGCVVCGDKRGKVRGLSELVEWARGIRH